MLAAKKMKPIDPRELPQLPKETLKPWTYSPGELLPDLTDHIGQVLEVRVPAKYLTAHHDRVVERQVWGQEIYTDDSDIIAVLAHSGFFILGEEPPVDDLVVKLNILPPKKVYQASAKRGYRSRRWAEHDGCSISVKTVYPIKLNSIETKEKELIFARRDRNKRRKQLAKRRGKNMEFGEFLHHVTINFNNSNDPSLKYLTQIIADRGTSMKEWTAYRFRKEVLYLESTQVRYELSMKSYGGNDSKDQYVKYRWAADLDPQKHDLAWLSEATIPMKDGTEVEVLEDDLEWSSIIWTPDSVIIRGKEYFLVRCFWRPIRST
eukprot:Clim_evm3s104 gene=Clim_evmTU3s104